MNTQTNQQLNILISLKLKIKTEWDDFYVGVLPPYTSFSFVGVWFKGRQNVRGVALHHM